MASDSFNPASQLIPTKIGPLEITLKIWEEFNEADPPVLVTKYSGRYSFDQLTATNVIVEVRQGDLTPHLTPAQVTSVKNFMDAMKLKAVGSLP